MNIRGVENLAELARIDLPEEEKQSLVSDFDSILKYIQSIEQVELDTVAPVYDLKNVWREDEIEERQFSRDSIIDQFPDRQDNFLKVKKIL